MPKANGDSKFEGATTTQAFADKLSNQRDTSIDILRGLAIFIMVFANLGPVMESSYPFILRFYGSLAAPIFITLAGMMVCLTYQIKQHSFKYYLIRGFSLIIIGMLIDILIWQIVPFRTVDVLYLIGLSLPLVYLANKLNLKLLSILTAFIFLITPIIQKFLGYSPYPIELDLSGNLTVEIDGQTSIFHHWIVDGWFPIFPWLGMACFGSILGKLRAQTKTFNRFQKESGFLLIILGGILWTFHKGPMYQREGYRELFYPPVTGFFILTIGIIILLFYLVDRTRNWQGWSFLKILGKSSLFMYIFHCSAIGLVVLKQWENLNILSVLTIYIVLLTIMVVLGVFLKKIKAKKSENNYLFRLLLGGK